MARNLITLGFEAAALQGGYRAWKATQPVELKTPLLPRSQPLPLV